MDTYAAQRTNGISVGRIPDGYGPWAQIDKPSPGEPNMHAKEEVDMHVPYMPMCMVEEFESSKNAQGYSGGTDGFCEDFKAQMFEAKPEVRRRISEVRDPQFRTRIVDEVIDRKWAAAREERAAKLNVTDEDMRDGIKDLLGAETTDIGGELREMNQKFKGMLYDIVASGSATEKDEMRGQIDSYLKTRDGTRKSITIDPDYTRAHMNDDNLTLCGTKEYTKC